MARKSVPSVPPTIWASAGTALPVALIDAVKRAFVTTVVGAEARETATVPAIDTGCVAW
jgi:hypothetical protein